jgi:hypothetical protein
MLPAKPLQSLGQRPDREIGASAEDESRRLAAGAGINRSNSTALDVSHFCYTRTRHFK